MIRAFNKEEDEKRRFEENNQLLTRAQKFVGSISGLTNPLFHIFDHAFSGRDLILLFGGVFLLFKGTMELRERLENKPMLKEENPVHATFWMVIVQIVVLDAVFSLDSVITAVGMVKELSVMMVAVIIAVGIMLWASKPLMNFVNRHDGDARALLFPAPPVQKRSPYCRR